MVQVIENRADFEGRLLGVREDESRPGHKLITIEVQTVQSVEAFPNLLAGAAGTSIEVVLPGHAAGSLTIGATVRCRVRRTGPSAVFAESCSEIGK